MGELGGNGREASGSSLIANQARMNTAPGSNTCPEQSFSGSTVAHSFNDSYSLSHAPSTNIDQFAGYQASSTGHQVVYAMRNVHPPSKTASTASGTRAAVSLGQQQSFPSLQNAPYQQYLTRDAQISITNTRSGPNPGNNSISQQQLVYASSAGRGGVALMGSAGGNRATIGAVHGDQGDLIVS